MYEYTTEVFSVGLQGLAPVDDDRLAELAGEGWEPTLMTPVHNGFATLVLFRRASDGPAPAPAKAKAKPAARARPAASRASAGRPAAPAAGRAANAGRVRRARPT